ncbi:hypothetical protein ACJJH9_08195 [Microbulbifer sp. DLAB2-AF]|uniref:hypothetical protein n=1 Tax=Microbulbifer sp. DLAB2-AF TaxID=3243395 RepID=UPI0040397FB5
MSIKVNKFARFKPLTKQEKQTEPMPGEADPKEAKMKGFMTVQKTKNKFKIKK